ncbi:LLM class flavin-dependent oxidoreductase [Roseomonas sp. GC11]|uniref:LLM class flavin-dependent oxidoreductase n=1 Tax=Roseomonas sp. GC11 TaxID=2950546 RepID=UPI00210E8F2D|nr:LLM class flavin-dependent oxidoreductase [Roseomonas sp. GC11]MCQ4159025.1 LLM class flavin-dependent oxidoreductase [Roseomonas sp. GC11]
MEFGIFILMSQRGYHQTSDQVIRNAVEQTVAADQAGFNTAWYAEHHFSNYGLCPSPLMMVAHMAAQTKRIRLGSAVCVLPMYHPARLLAEAGFADSVSNGRLEFGVGSGYQKFEFDRFGVKIEEAPEIFNEFLDILQLGMREKSFQYGGRHLRMPETSISIRTRQSPMPPIWLATGNPETQARAIREGHNLFVTALLNGTDKLQQLRDGLVKVAAGEGRDIDDTKVGLLRCAYASDNEAEIMSYVENARYQRRVSEGLKLRRARSDDGFLVQEEPGLNEPSLDQIRANLPVGSVDYVVERLVEEIRILRPKHVAIQTQVGDFDQKTMLRQIELWGSRIIPAIRRELGVSAAQAAA